MWPNSLGTTPFLFFFFSVTFISKCASDAKPQIKIYNDTDIGLPSVSLPLIFSHTMVALHHTLSVLTQSPSYYSENRRTVLQVWVRWIPAMGPTDSGVPSPFSECYGQVKKKFSFFSSCLHSKRDGVVTAEAGNRNDCVTEKLFDKTITNSTRCIFPLTNYAFCIYPLQGHSR